jgi:hypothetical protein
MERAAVALERDRGFICNAFADSGNRCAAGAGEPCAMPTIELKRGNVLRLRGARGTTVTARWGAVWITEEESLRDVVLAPGESFTLVRPGLALIQAFGDASIRVDDEQPRRAA